MDKYTVPRSSAGVISRLFVRNQVARINVILKGLASVYTAIAAGLFLALGVAFWALYGAYDRFWLYFAIFAVYYVGVFVNVLCGPCGFTLNMTGQEATSTRIVLRAVAWNTVLNLALIPFMGAIGAAAATSVAVTYMNVAMSRASRRGCGVRPGLIVRG